MDRIKIKLEYFLKNIDKKKLMIILISVITLVVILLLMFYLFSGSKFELNRTLIELDLVENNTSKLYTTLNDKKNNDVTWTSSNEKIVKVDKNGNVQSVGIGEAQIVAKYRNSKKIVKVLVTDLPKTLTMDKEIHLDLKDNREYQLEVNIYLDIVTYDSKYKSSNENIVKVSEDGNLTAVSVGTAIVTAEYDGLTTECKVIVENDSILTTVPIDNDSLAEDALDKISKEDYELDNDESVTTQPVTRVSILETMIYLSATNSRKLTVYVYPKSIENPILNWTSSNESIATVDENGVVTGISKGTAIITATATNGKKTTCVVSVLNQLPESIRFKDKFLSIDMAKSTTEKLTIVYEPANSSSTNVKWTVSDESIIRISSSGVVTALKTGYVDVTASTSNGLTASTRVFVNESSSDSRGWHYEYTGGPGVQRDIYYYMQGNYRDVKWCGTSYKSIASSGCGATSLAIVISTLLDVKITPIDTMNQLHSFGKYCGGGISGTALAGIEPTAKSYGLYTLTLNKSSCSQQKLKEALLRGDTMAVVIVKPGAFTKGGHYITLSGYDKGKFYVYDPNRGFSSANDPYSYSRRNAWWNEKIIISQCRSNFWLVSTSPLNEIKSMC